jgi:hypothetical protein
VQELAPSAATNSADYHGRPVWRSQTGIIAPSQIREHLKLRKTKPRAPAFQTAHWRIRDGGWIDSNTWYIADSDGPIIRLAAPAPAACGYPPLFKGCF